MRRARTRSVGRAAYRTGFTIVEAVISTIIVAVMLVAALSTVGTSRVVQQKTSLADRGRLLAEALAAEIARKPYEEPEATVAFGTEAGEGTSNRKDFDDVDDYDGWSASPPTASDGMVLPNASGWTRSVAVVWVDAQNPTTVETTESGAKRITVTAKFNNVSQATLVAVRTDH